MLPILISSARMLRNAEAEYKNRFNGNVGKTDPCDCGTKMSLAAWNSSSSTKHSAILQMNWIASSVQNWARLRLLQDHLNSGQNSRLHDMNQVIFFLSLVLIFAFYYQEFIVTFLREIGLNEAIIDDIEIHRVTMKNFFIFVMLYLRFVEFWNQMPLKLKVLMS